MSHVRTQIRNEAVALIGGSPLLAGRVKASRVYAVQRTPYVIVYTSEEEAETDIIGDKSMRSLILTAEIYSAAGTDQFDTEIDNLAVEVEKALARAPGKFAMCKDYQYEGMGVEYSGEGEKAGGAATINYRFSYRVDISDPEQGV